MSKTTLDVVGIGNAIVDVLARCDDPFLASHNILKGGMVLIEEPQAQTIYSAMGESVAVPGGSAANSIACIASLGGQGGFVGKVADDPLGQTFRSAMEDQGVEFATAPLDNGPGTGRCLINVTPDAERSMMTFLGAAAHVTLNDIDEDQIKRAAITFFEGYLFEQPVAREAFVKACAIARNAGRKSALTLSDTSCVDRQHDVLTGFIPNHVDILLANEAEASTLFQTNDMDAIIEKAKAFCPLTAITRSGKGSIIIPRDGEPVTVAAIAPTQLVDTTGAGDGYAAGFLYGIARNFDLERAGRLGSLAASEVISHMGPRPETSLEKLAIDADLLSAN